MIKAEVEAITSERRPRPGPRAERELIVAAALEPGATILCLAREYSVHSSQVFRWYQQLCGKNCRSGVRIYQGGDHSSA